MKKLFLVFIALVLAASVLAGCGFRGRQNSGDTASNDLQEGYDPFGGKDNTDENFQRVKYDLGGRIIRIVNEQGNTGNASDYDHTPRLEKQPIRYYSMIDTQEFYNCQFQYLMLPAEQAAENLKVNHMAGTAEYDAYYLRGEQILPELINGNFCLALSDYYAFDKDPAWTNAHVRDMGWWNGVKYSMLMDAPNYGYAMWYNKALLAKYNLQDPWTHIGPDTWNWQTFRDYCVKATKRVPGNPSESFYGFSSETPGQTFIVSNGGTIVDIVGGKATLVYDTPEAIEALEYLVGLVGKDKVMPATAEIQALPGINQGVLPEYGAMATGHVLFFNYMMGYCGFLEKSGLDAKDIGVIYVPKGPKASTYRISSPTQPGQYVIPATLRASDREMVVAALQDNFAYWSKNKQSYTPLEDGYQNAFNDDWAINLYGKNRTDDHLRQIFMENGALTVYTLEYNFANNYDTVREVVKVFDTIFRGESNVKTALAVNKSSIQALIDAAASVK